MGVPAHIPPARRLPRGCSHSRMCKVTVYEKFRLGREDNLDLAGGIGHGHPRKTAPHRPNWHYDTASRGAYAPEKSRTAERVTIDNRQSAAPCGAPGAPRSLYRPSRDTDRTARKSGHDCSPSVRTLFRDA